MILDYVKMNYRYFRRKLLKKLFELNFQKKTFHFHQKNNSAMSTPFQLSLEEKEDYTDNFGKSHPRVPFSKDEDNLLKKLVNKYGTANWAPISKQMPGRNSRQCRDRWLNYLSPDVVNGPWTAEEDELLVQKYNEIGPYWKKIAAFFPTRTDINIKSRWNLRERRIKKEKLEAAKNLYYKGILSPTKLPDNSNTNSANNNDQTNEKSSDVQSQSGMLDKNKPVSVSDIQNDKSKTTEDKNQEKKETKDHFNNDKYITEEFFNNFEKNQDNDDVSDEIFDFE